MINMPGRRWLSTFRPVAGHLYRQGKRWCGPWLRPLRFYLHTARWRRRMALHKRWQKLELTIRPLATPDPHLLVAIDVSETIYYRYRVVHGQLEKRLAPRQRLPWDAAEWQQSLTRWITTMQPDLFLGAYHGEQIVGMASLRYHLTPTMAHLTSLFVSRPYRQWGVGAQLVQAVSKLAQAQGAEALYVSSVPTLPTVQFYLRQGFRLAADPHPVLFALDPVDIHMIKPMGAMNA